MTPLKLKDVLMESLKYPPIAQPDFFLQKYRESGWSRDVYFEALFSELDGLYEFLQSRKQQKDRKDKEVKLPPELAALGLNPDLLIDLYLAVDDAYQRYDASSGDSAEQILALLEGSLIYIEDDFSAKAGKRMEDASEKFSKSGKVGKEVDPASFLRYKERAPKLLFDFNLVKSAIRHLLLYCAHPDKLQAILRPCYERCRRIVELWNTEVYSGGVDPATGVFLHFFPDSEHSSNPYVKMGHIKQSRNNAYALYYARFAHEVGNLIMSEVQGEVNEIPEPARPDGFYTYVLLKLFYEKGCKPLTKTQVLELSKVHDGISKSSLIKHWNKLDDYKYEPRKSANSVRAFLRAQERIMQEFESSSEAFTAAKKHYDRLKNAYPHWV